MFASPSVEAAVPPADLNQYQKATLARAAAKRKRQRPRGAAATSALLKAAGIAGATGRTPKGLEAAAEAERLRLPGAAEWNDERRRWAPVGRTPRSQKAVTRRPLAQAALVAANGEVVKPLPMDTVLPLPAVEVEIDTTEKKSRFYEDTMEQMLTRIGASGTTRICRPPQRFPYACSANMELRCALCLAMRRIRMLPAHRC